MSSGKGFPPDDLKGRAPDPDSQPSNIPTWRTNQVWLTGTGGGPSTPPSYTNPISYSTPPEENASQYQAQPDAVHNSWRPAGSNGGKTKSPGSKTDSTRSSSTDGGVRLDIEYSPIQKGSSTVQNDAASVAPPTAEPTDVPSQASTIILPENAPDGTASEEWVNVSLSEDRVSDGPSSNKFPQEEIPSAPLPAPLPAPVEQMLADITEKVTELIDLPQAMKDILKHRVANLLRDMVEIHGGMQLRLDNVGSERDLLKHRLEDSRRLLDAIMQDRVRLTIERDAAQLRIEKLDLESKKIINALEESARVLKNENEALIARLRAQDDQLKSKPAFWNDYNPTSASRSRALSRANDPFHTPNPSPGMGRGTRAEFNTPGYNSRIGTQGEFNSPTHKPGMGRGNRGGFNSRAYNPGMGRGNRGGFNSPPTYNPGMGRGNRGGFNSPAYKSGFGRGTRGGFNSHSPMPGNLSSAGKDKMLDSPNRGPQHSSMYDPPSSKKFGSGPARSSSVRSQTAYSPSPNMSFKKGHRRHRSPMAGYSPTPGYLEDKQGADALEPTTNLHSYNTEPSDYFAVVPFTPEEDRFLEFKTAIGHVFHLVEDWAKAYADNPDYLKDHVIAKSNMELWDYMMNCTYPGLRQEAHDHVVMLLTDPITRILFVTRMAVTYCVQDIMSVDSFKDFSQPVSEAIEDAKIKLQERGLANDSRQTLIDRQAEAIQSILESPTFATFRTNQLNIHTKRLRDMLGPMLNDGCDRCQAGKELGIIAVKSWDVATKMYTSHLSFQIYFPETTAKFNASNMVATDVRADPVKLQLLQAPLELVITPVVTMRDDRGTTIKVKNLHMASVLVTT